MEHNNSHGRVDAAADGYIRDGSIYRPAPRIDESKAWFRLEVRRSKIHRWGVFALEDIPARRRVIEYTGEKIDNEEHERRSEGRDLLYFFTVSPRRVLDPGVGGSGAEFINHSCDPNCETDEVDGRVWITAISNIAAGEEITYDYCLYDGGDEEQLCNCNTRHCRGSMYSREELRQRLAVKVDIKLTAEDRGQIVLRFESNDDFTRVIDWLRRADAKAA